MAYYTAEETVFGIPELRRYILGFYLEKTVPIRKQKTCKDKTEEICMIPGQCCCSIYCFCWIAYKTRCFRRPQFTHDV